MSDPVSKATRVMVKRGRAKKGDYPGLDSRSKRFYRWARQAGAYALIGVVSMYVIAGVFFGDALFSGVLADARHVVTEAKLGETFYPETIKISDLSPHVEPSSSRSPCASVECRAVYSLAAAPHFNSGRDHVAVPLETVLLDYGASKEGVMIEHTINEPAHISRWQMPDILESNIARKESLATGKSGDTKRVNADIGALENSGVSGLVLGCSFRVAGEPIGGLPEFFGGNPQSPREDGQNNCEYAGNRPLILVKGFQNPEDADENRAIKGGAVFVCLLLLCAAAGIGAYWMAVKQ